MIGEIKLFFVKRQRLRIALKKSSLIGQNLHVSFYLQRNNETKIRDCIAFDATKMSCVNLVLFI